MSFKGRQHRGWNRQLWIYILETFLEDLKPLQGAFNWLWNNLILISLPLYKLQQQIRQSEKMIAFSGNNSQWVWGQDELPTKSEQRFTQSGWIDIFLVPIETYLILNVKSVLICLIVFTYRWAHILCLYMNMLNILNFGVFLGFFLNSLRVSFFHMLSGKRFLRQETVETRYCPQRSQI